MIALIVPVIAAIFWILLKFATGAYWQFPDPAFGYLSSSLSLFKGFPPTFNYQPGTSVEILGAVLIFLLNIGHSTAQAVHQVLLDPEFYLNAMNGAMVVFSLLASFLLGRYVLRQTKDVLATFLSQLPLLGILSLRSYSFYDYVLPVITNVSPEPLLIGISSLFNLFFLKLFFADKKEQELFPTLLLGFICGLGISSKLTYVSFLLLPLIVCRGRLKIPFLAVSVISTILWTIPIIPQYPWMQHWITRLATHDGWYGNGSPRIINPHLYIANLKYMLFSLCSPLTLFAAVALLISLGQTIKKGMSRGGFFLLATAFCLLTQFAVIAKHYDEHYLVSTINLFAVFFVLFYLNIKNKTLPIKRIITLCMSVYAIYAIHHAWEYNKQLSGYTKQAQLFNLDLHHKYPDASFIGVYPMPMSIPEAAIFWANDRDNRQQDELADLYPKGLAYFSNSLNDYAPYVYGIFSIKQRVFADDLLRSGKTVLFVAPKDYDFSQTPYAVSKVEQGRYAAAFLLLKSTEKQANELLYAAIKLTEAGDYRDAFLIALKSKELHYQPEGKVTLLLSLLYPHIPHR